MTIVTLYLLGLGLREQEIRMSHLIRLRNSPIWFFILVLEANPILRRDNLLRLLMLSRLPTINSFRLFKRPSETKNSMLEGVCYGVPIGVPTVPMITLPLSTEQFLKFLCF